MDKVDSIEETSNNVPQIQPLPPTPLDAMFPFAPLGPMGWTAMSSDFEKHFTPQQWPLVQALKRLSYEQGRADEAAASIDLYARPLPVHKKSDPELPLDTPRRDADLSDPIETSDGQLPRGLAFKWVQEEVQNIGNATVTVREIAKRVHREKGKKISYNSVRRSFERLIEQGALERITDTNAFRRPAKLRAVG